MQWINKPIRRLDFGVVQSPKFRLKGFFSGALDRSELETFNRCHFEVFSVRLVPRKALRFCRKQVGYAKGDLTLLLESAEKPDKPLRQAYTEPGTKRCRRYWVDSDDALSEFKRVQEEEFAMEDLSGVTLIMPGLKSKCHGLLVPVFVPASNTHCPCTETMFSGFRNGPLVEYCPQTVAQVQTEVTFEARSV